MTMSFELSQPLIWRLAIAGALGAAIGIEREFRAKEAGLRTHFLVALGSALFTIVSQYGFEPLSELYRHAENGARLADTARVAAQIVTGIGFIGAGAIMVQKHYVRGLTTAAGLWVVAAIGMAAGGGLYMLAVMGTIFALIGLELFRLLLNWVSLKTVEIVFCAKNPADADEMLKRIHNLGFQIVNYKLTYMKGSESVRVHLSAREKSRSDSLLSIYTKLQTNGDSYIESIG